MSLTHTEAFVAGQDGVHTYRIPAIVVAPSGALLVSCEARKDRLSDAGPTDMVLKRSLDRGATWLPMQTLVSGEGAEAIMKPVAQVTFDRALNECPCQASIIRFGSAEADGRSRIIFAIPDNVGEEFGVERTNITVRISYDEARTWPVKKRVHAGPSSYSGLARLPEGDVRLVFEGGETHRREWIRFVRLPLAWLEAVETA